VGPSETRTTTIDRRGHYSDDGRWWWDDDRGDWYATTGPDESCEVVLEDDGNRSLLRSIVTTLTGQAGTQSYRFVARALGIDLDAPGGTVASDTFPVLPLSLVEGHVAPEEGWPEEVRAALAGLDEDLVSRGWQRRGRGEHWWSYRYTRPRVDWARPRPPAA
jgi:hypothetical protein